MGLLEEPLGKWAPPLLSLPHSGHLGRGLPLPLWGNFRGACGPSLSREFFDQLRSPGGANYPAPWTCLKAEPSRGPPALPPKLWDGCGAALVSNGHHPFLIRKITKKKKKGWVSESQSQVNLNNIPGEIQSLKTETPTRGSAPARLEGRARRLN